MENAARISMLQTAKKRPQRSRRHISLYQFHHPRPIHVSKHWHMPKWPGDYVEWVHDSHWNQKPSYSKVSSQSSHPKSPKSPNGEISPNILVETRRASNSVWKIGITSFIRMTQSIVRPIENVAFLRISDIFETLLLWTASFKWSLWYQFSTQNLMLYKFHIIGLAKFRHLAILAIFGGYFGYFLKRPRFVHFEIDSFGIMTYSDGIFRWETWW